MTESNNKLKNRYIKAVFFIFFMFLSLLILVWMYALYISMDAYRQGEIFYEEGSYIKAVTYFDRSLHSYTPLNPFIWKSAEKLWTIGESALKEGDQKLALIAFRTIRRGFYSANNFYQPGKGWIERSDLIINSIIEKRVDTEKTQDDYSKWDGKIPDGQVFQSPDVFWTVILEIGITGWIGTMVCFILDIFRRERKNKRKRIISYLSVTLLFFALWILGMVKA